MTRLDIRLLGELEISGSRRVVRFESQRARALIAYLAAHPGRAFSRDQLAGLFWPHHGETAARQNLRQALYNLRAVLQVPEGAPPLISAEQGSIRFAPGEHCWVDLHAFSEAIDRGWGDGDVADPRELARAAQLYRGDFLAGFFLSDSPPFEEWMLAEQERLRESAVAALRALVAHHLRSGGHVFGIQYARQLLRIDPLSEEVHRQLMLLYAYTGRRSRALEDYESFERLLGRELGVEPMEETRQLHRQILDESLPALAGGEHKAAPRGPLIPLVGREEASQHLHHTWRAASDGQGCLTLVEGEAGIGKSRLVRAVLDEITSRERATVFLGRSYDLAPPVAFQPLIEALRNSLASEVEIAERITRLPLGDALADVARLVPELGELRPELAPRPGDPPPLPVGRLAIALGAFFHHVTAGAGAASKPRPLILFLDNLQWMDDDTFNLLHALLPEIADLPVWVVATYRPQETASSGLAKLLAAAGAPRGRVRRLSLDRLSAESVARIAVSLVGKQGSATLARFLFAATEGAPLLLTEWINLLWDEGALVPEGKSWRLTAVPKQFGGQLGSHLPARHEDLVLRRIRRLPSSTRRLLTLASLIGQRFEAELLEAAEQEDGGVVETCVEMMLQRWLVRHFLRYWADSRRQRDVALWVQGARHGTFEFAHPSIRRAIAASLSPERAQILHRRIAEAIEARLPADRAEACELLAYHFGQARMWGRAFEYSRMAAAKARPLAAATARHYYNQALAALDELDRQGEAAGAEERGERRRLILEEKGSLAAG